MPWLKASGVLHRTIKDEEEDTEKVFDKIENESWKDWPNHAGICSPPASVSQAPAIFTLADMEQFQGLEEHRGPLRLQVKGAIPAWATGALYRTGPGQSSIEDTSRGTHNVSHWFDGFAHTHKFEIIAPGDADGDSTVVYSSRRQSDDFVAQVKKTGWSCSTSFGQRADPCIGIFAKFMSLFVHRRMNNNVVCLPNFPGLAGDGPASSKSGHRTGTSTLYISTDHCALQGIDPDTLEPVGFANQQLLHPDLKGVMSCAHAQRPRDRGLVQL